jgi:putative lipoic acid-binding regulatory protein
MPDAKRFDPSQRPVITYPAPWSFKVIGTDEEDVRRAVKITLAVCLDPASGDRPYELGLSRTSGKGNYVSLNLTLTVLSEAERDAVFTGLADCPEIRMVI